MIFIKTIARTFYQSHTGFFLLLIFTCFGFLSGAEHIAIANFIAVSPLLCGVVMSGWILYSSYCLHYIYKLLMQSNYLVFRGVALQPFYLQLSKILSLFILLNLPVLLYAWFILFFAVSSPSRIVAGMIILYSVLSLFLSFLVLYRNLRKPIIEHTQNLLSYYWNNNFTKPYILWFYQYILTKPIVILVSKFSTITFLILIAKLYTTDDYDWRLIALSIILVVCLHIVFFQHYVTFLYSQLTFFHNIPTSLARMGLSTIATLSILLLPEWIILTKNFFYHVPPQQLVQLLLFGLMISFLFVQIMIYRLSNFEKILRLLFYIAIGLVFVIMFAIPLWVTNFFILVLAIWLHSRHYKFLPEFDI